MDKHANVRTDIERPKVEVGTPHSELPRNGSVVWTADNVSARVPGAELLVIKPSGVSYDDLTPDVMVVFDSRRAWCRIAQPVL